MLPEEFQTIFKTPAALCNEVAFVDEALKLNRLEKMNLWDLRHNKKMFHKSINPVLYAVNFITKSICSDYYKCQNPDQPSCMNEGINAKFETAW